MRPIFWGIIIFALGLAGWVVSIVFNVLTLGKFKEVSNLLITIVLAAIPVAIVLEIVRWLVKRKK